MLASQSLCDDMRIRNGSHRSETIVFDLIHLGLFAPLLDSSLSSGQLSRVKVNRILLLSSKAQEAANGDDGSLLGGLPSLQVPNEDLLKFTDGIVVVFDELRKLSDTTANVDGGGRIGDLKTGK
jgi:hypothetical protein